MAQPRDPEKWDDKDTKQLIDLSVAGHDIREISKIMGCTRGALGTKATRICLHIKGSRSASDFDPGKQTARRCMKCRGWMASDWIGARICDECKRTYEYRSAAG